MIIPTDFFYAAKVEDFVSLIKKQRIDDIVTFMCSRAQEVGVSCSDSEIKSWKRNFEAISQLLQKSKVAGDAIVSFEYKIPVGGRIDCVLFGHGFDGTANMLHIELKQWSNENVSEHYSGYTFCTDIVLTVIIYLLNLFKITVLLKKHFGFLISLLKFSQPRFINITVIFSDNI